MVTFLSMGKVDTKLSIIKKVLILLILILNISICLFSQGVDDCPNPANAGPPFSLTGFDWYDNELYQELTLNIDLTFLHRSDGTGNFEDDQSEIGVLENEMNVIWGSLGNSCPGIPYNEKSGIKVKVNAIHHEDETNAWSYNFGWQPGQYFCPNFSIEWPVLREVVEKTTTSNRINIIFIENGDLLDILEPAIGTDHGFQPGQFDSIDKKPHSGCSETPDDSLDGGTLLYVYIFGYYTEYIKRLYFSDVFEPTYTGTPESLWNQVKWTMKSLLDHEIGHTVMDTGHPCSFPCDSHLMMNASQCSGVSFVADKSFLDETALEALHCVSSRSSLHRYYDCEEDYDVEFKTRIVNNNNQIIFNTETFIRGNLRVVTGTELVIKDKVYLNKNSKIIVEKGARLIIESGGKLTSYNRCSNDWKGIYVEGNGTSQPSNPYGNLLTEDAGVVILENDAVIENARTGIKCYKFGESWNSDYYGGLIVAEGASFLDCGRGVAFMPMANDNSTFSNVTFDCKGTGVTAWRNHGVIYSECDFSGMSDSGIYGEGSTVKVYNGCKFEDNLHGIYLDYSFVPVTNTNKIGSDFPAIGNEFRNNGTDIKFYGSAHDNEIYNNQSWDADFSIDLDGLSVYDIRDNYFFSTKDKSVRLIATGGLNGRVDDNEFVNHLHGISALGYNENTGFDRNCFAQAGKADIYLLHANIEDNIGSQSAQLQTALVKYQQHLTFMLKDSLRNLHIGNQTYCMEVTNVRLLRIC